MIKASLENRNTGATAIPGRLADLVQLGKPRIASLVLISTALGYALGMRLAVHGHSLWHHFDGVFWALMAGTLLISWGGNAINQFMERDTDALMARTRNRPLPSGRLHPEIARTGGAVATLGGIAALFLGVNPLSAAIGAVVAVIYVFVYTPLKRRTQLNTLVGAIPGALPPVLGWAAARDGLGLEALVLFLIMFAWQLPHFLPIAWLYRDDYRRAGLHMITVDDPTGGSTRRQSILYAATLVLLSLQPTWAGFAGPIYFAGALVLGILFFATVIFMSLRLDDRRATLVLKASVIYLPLLLGLLVYDGTGF